MTRKLSVPSEKQGRQPVTPQGPTLTPYPLSSPAPRYPRSARYRHAEGLVLVRAMISPQGSVMEVQLARTSGSRDLDESAVEAVQKWRFSPGLDKGTKIRSWVNVPVRFQLEDRTD
jgi:periplasmic protein TonB